MFQFSYTLTCTDGFQPEHLAAFKKWFSDNTDSCLVVTELHATGKLHLHAGTKQKHKTAGELTRRWTKLYETLNIPCVKGVSIHIRKTTDLVGWFHYLTKDLEGPPLYVQGWQMTWIQQQCKDNLKKMPHKLIKGSDHTMNMVTATNLVIAYAKNADLPLSGKDSFKTVICCMAKDGYQLHNLKFKILYSQIMARFDDFRPLKSLLDMELDFLD